jgi:hypothetical protein
VRARSGLTELRRLALALPAAALLGVALSAAPAGAQDRALADACAFGSTACLRAAQAAAILHGAAPAAAVAGNPVPGTASTLGIRIGSFPRLSLGARIGASRVAVPDILRSGSGTSRGHLLSAFMLDAATGITPGFSPLPTVGGVASLDAVASTGFLLTPGDFSGSAPFVWGVGVRLGLLRESFTMPGASVTAMWRGAGAVHYGDPSLQRTNAFASAASSGPSVRAAVGKRLFGVGLTGGLGYDSWRGDVAWSGDGAADLRVRGHLSSRRTAFANLAWTFLVLHAVAEGGWISGPDLLPGLDRTAAGLDPSRGGFFGGVALRLSI